MLKVRAILEEKLKKKGVFNSITPKTGEVHNHCSETVSSDVPPSPLPFCLQFDVLTERVSVIMPGIWGH